MSHLYKRNHIYWLAFYKDGKLCRQSLKTKDRTTALYLKSKIDEKVSGGTFLIYSPKLSCQKVLEEYQKSCQYRKTEDTHKDEGLKIQRFLEWAEISKMGQVSEKKLQEYLNYRINHDKITLNTANHIIANVKTFLNFAVRNRYIADNPLRNIRRYRLPENPPHFLTREEIEKFLAEAKKTSLYPVIATALYTGMRQKELFTLEWPDIDFSRNFITIRNKEGFTTKTKKFRAIPLHPQLKVVLEACREQKGLCFDTTNQRRVFSGILKRAGLKKIGWHTLRHTCASYLAMQGVDVVTIAKLLGHASISTSQIYMHLAPEHLKDSINKLSF